MSDFGAMVRTAREARGWSQDALALKVGTTQSTIDRIESGFTKRSRWIIELAGVLDLPLPGGGGTSIGRREAPGASAAPAWTEAPEAPEFDKAMFPRDVPLRGIAACGDDASFILNGQTGDYVRRPPGIAGRRSVYALNVFGDSMYPVYRHNALVYVDPHRTPAVTEDAVIEMHPEDPNDNEPGKGFLKRVKAIRGGKIVCEQFNPPGEIEFDRSDVKSFHRVIPWEEVLGY